MSFCFRNAFDTFITITSNLLWFFTIVLYWYFHLTHEKHTWSFILKTEVRHFVYFNEENFWEYIYIYIPKLPNILSIPLYPLYEIAFKLFHDLTFLLTCSPLHTEAKWSITRHLWNIHVVYPALVSANTSSQISHHLLPPPYIQFLWLNSPGLSFLLWQTHIYFSLFLECSFSSLTP